VQLSIIILIFKLISNDLIIYFLSCKACLSPMCGFGLYSRPVLLIFTSSELVVSTNITHVFWKNYLKQFVEKIMFP